MIFEEMNGIYFENYTKPIINCVGQMRSCLMLQEVVHVVTTELQNDDIF
jgi:hypothetical protein